MKHFQSYLLPLVILFLFSSCAATYKRVNPSEINYPAVEEDGTLSYKYNVLREASNKKLAKKEMKTSVRVVAIKLVNTTGQTLVYGQNFKIYSGSGEAQLLTPTEATASIKQTAPLYLLYLLLTPMRLNVYTPEKSSSTPIGLVIGPALAAGNFAVAATANSRFKQELIEKSIAGVEIKNGETFYGLVAIKDNSYMPLVFKMIR